MKYFNDFFLFCTVICCNLIGYQITSCVAAKNKFELSRKYEILGQRIRRNALTVKQILTNKKEINDQIEHFTTNYTKYPLRPRFTSSRNSLLPLDPQIYRCKEKLSRDCHNKTKEFRRRILGEFHKSLVEPVDEPNIYNVPFDVLFEKSSTPSVCMLLNAKVKTLRRKHVPDEMKEIKDIFPIRKLFAKQKRKSCAIVSSAGSLNNSKLGPFIDAHDIVMRFNHAPTKGYENHVGRKTTVRVVNSQVVSKPEFNFIESPMFRNISIAAWDPAKYNATLLKWFYEPDFNLFENYYKYKKQWPNSDFHLVDPRSMWNLWNELQRFSSVRIRKNPPTSGFIGLALLVPACSYIDVIEYMPSTRLNGKCHYYDTEINLSCTFGAWHPLAAEKLMAYDMNIANDYSVFQNGVMRIRQPAPGFCNN